ncbi:hypothetical protein [Polyangium sp. 15x6]|uniref:hypothetical protein n=1 Tax=Polyangium sp. 15x6 TaxID=3042687 RepID=UPI00249CBB47|nr:hypothetical protein [Polyangium sp. 15x6]MDI3286141.1 hypothetical protein [Polyangium sp. 15x6]
MIRLPKRVLPKAAREKLCEYQDEIDALPDYADRVERAKTSFAARNRKGDPTFDAVKKTLTAMCSGAQRCAYCEDSAADEVEHIRPKSLYPEAAFLWSNYLYACGPCNGPKNNRYAVFAQATGNFTDVTRRRKAPVVPPVPGAPVLIDPRKEDPSAFLWLDLQNTFFFTPLASLGPTELERARYTIDVLGLNKRDLLPKARQQAFKDYKAHLSQYRTSLAQGAPARRLRQLERDIQERGHPTVWAEMKRQHALLPVLRDLFHAVPQALGW